MTFDTVFPLVPPLADILEIRCYIVSLTVTRNPPSLCHVDSQHQIMAIHRMVAVDPRVRERCLTVNAEISWDAALGHYGIEHRLRSDHFRLVCLRVSLHESLPNNECRFL